MVDRCDGMGQALVDLTPVEAAGYIKNTKRHLYSHHGLDTTALDVHPLNVGELEAIHYMVHELGYVKVPHTHAPSRLPDLGIRLNLPPVEAARSLVLKIREKIEARREREE